LARNSSIQTTYLLCRPNHNDAVPPRSPTAQRAQGDFTNAIMTVLMGDAVSTVAFDSAKFGPGSSLIAGCLAEELLRVERDKLRRAHSELIALLSPAGLEYEVPLRTLCHEYLVEACRMTLRIVSSSLSLLNYGNSQPMSSRNQLLTYKYVWTCESLGKWSKIRVTF
jgi:hypothetical protein